MSASSDCPPGFHDEFMGQPITVVSCDSHIGPRLEEDLRPYCPKKYLPQFDEYAKKMALRRDKVMFARTATGQDAERLARAMKNIRLTAGHHDISARLRDMDKDGVCAEVIFPSSHNGESEPFVGTDLALNPLTGNCELFEVGMKIYSDWLADFCKRDTDRLIGLVTPPLWDIQASIRTVESAHRAGLKGIYLLAPRAGIQRYDHPAWEPFWNVCEDLSMNLNVHSGGPVDGEVTAIGAVAAFEIELGGWPARKAAHQMIFAGVFERYPRLKIVFTEQNFDWWTQSIREFDSVYENHRSIFKSTLKNRPSEYMSSNVYIGASFLAPFEAMDAHDHKYTNNVMWGRDYGHIEGTFVVTDHCEAYRNPSRLSMRYALSKLPTDEISQIVSRNALDFYQLDADKLDGVARNIGAPSLVELSTPIHSIPEDGGLLAFRTIGAWA